MLRCHYRETKQLVSLEGEQINSIDYLALWTHLSKKVDHI